MATMRMLLRSPGFAIPAILLLTLGIGASTAIFALMNGTLFQALPYPEADRIGQIWLTDRGGEAGVTLSVPEINELAGDGTFETLAAYDFGGPGANLTGAGEPENVKAIHVSQGYFRLFGARVEAGRTFTAGEDRPGGGRVAVLSHELWVRRFNSDRGLIGSPIHLGSESYLVAGVLAPGFQPDPPAQIWLPLQLDPASTGQAHFLRAVARLKRGITFEQSNQMLQAAAARLQERFPANDPQLGFAVKPLRETSAGPLRSSLYALGAAVLCLLFIACSNVSSLFLARTHSRQREFAIRRALGASRGRIICQVLAEGSILSLVGGALGLAFGRLGLQAVLALYPGILSAGSLDARVAGFTVLLSLASTLAFGLLPALRISRGQLTGRSSSGRESMRVRSLLVVAQVAFAVALVVAAGLMIRTYAALRQVTPGIDARRVLTLQMSLEGSRFRNTNAVDRLSVEGVRHLQQIAGVESAATTWLLPVEVAFSTSLIIEGRPLTSGKVHGGALMRPVSPGYAAVFRIPIRRGRFFSGADSTTAAGVCVISEALARKFWPDGRNPVGERITIDKYLGPDFAAPPRQIVGVVADVRDLGIASAPAPLIYIPQSQVPNGMTRIDSSILPITWAVRTKAEPNSLQKEIQEALRAASGGLAVTHVRSMEEIVRQSTARSDFTSLLFLALGLASLMLAAAGIYTLVCYSVEQREREIGIRVALGATPAQVRTLIVTYAVRLTALGLLIGASVSVALARCMDTLVFGVSPVDPIAFGGALGVLSLAAYLACLLPARRTSKIDPARSLQAV